MREKPIEVSINEGLNRNKSSPRFRFDSGYVFSGLIIGRDISNKMLKNKKNFKKNRKKQ